MTGDLSIGELARAAGVGIETIRYYERIGLMAAPPRTGSGRRIYGQRHLDQLRFVRRGREVGFSLADIRALLAISGRTGSVCGQVLEVAKPHLASVRHRIAELQRFEVLLADAVEGCIGGLSAPECPVLGMLR